MFGHAWPGKAFFELTPAQLLKKYFQSAFHFIIDMRSPFWHINAAKYQLFFQNLSGSSDNVGAFLGFNATKEAEDGAILERNVENRAIELHTATLAPFENSICSRTYPFYPRCNS